MHKWICPGHEVLKPSLQVFIIRNLTTEDKWLSTNLANPRIYWKTLILISTQRNGCGTPGGILASRRLAAYPVSWRRWVPLAKVPGVESLPSRLRTKSEDVCEGLEVEFYWLTYHASIHVCCVVERNMCWGMSRWRLGRWASTDCFGAS